MQHLDEAAPSSHLDQLIACEAELAELLSLAEEEAARRVEEAAAEARRAEADLEASLEAEADVVRSRIHEDTQSRVRQIQADARRRAERFDTIVGDEVHRLAERAFRRLMLGEEGG